MPRRRLYRELLREDSDGAAAFYIKGREVKQGEVLYVTTASAEDADSGSADIAFGILVGTEFYAFEEVRNQSEGIAWFTRKTRHFLVGEQPVIRFEDTSSGDDCKVTFEGYYEEVP